MKYTGKFDAGDQHPHFEGNNNNNNNNNKLHWKVDYVNLH